MGTADDISHPEDLVVEMDWQVEDEVQAVPLTGLPPDPERSGGPSTPTTQSGISDSEDVLPLNSHARMRPEPTIPNNTGMVSCFRRYKAGNG